MNKRPQRSVVDLHSALGQLGPKTAQRKVCLCTLQQPFLMLAGQLARSINTHFGSSHTARRVMPLQPFDCHAHRNAKTLRRCAARHDNPLVSTASNTRLRRSIEHGRGISCWPPIPARSLTHKIENLETPRRYKQASYRARAHPRCRPASVSGSKPCSSTTGLERSTAPASVRRSVSSSDYMLLDVAPGS